MALKTDTVKSRSDHLGHGLRAGASGDGQVKRRHVFFLSGFDPKGAAHYHRLYREQAALQGAVTGTAYKVSARKTLGNGNAVWTVCSGGTETVYEYVRWDDVVRAHWPRGAWQVLMSALQVYALVLLEAGALRKIWRVANRTLVALFYPALYWLGVGLLAALGAGLMAWLCSALMAWPASAAGVMAGLVAGGVLWAGWWLEQRLHTSWLLRIFRFADRHAKGQVPELSARWDGLADQIRQALCRPEVDEVLLVGFSVGSMGAVSVAARTLQRCSEAPQVLARFSVLTLGHCIPLFALMPAAHALRDELACVGASREVFWLDCSSPSDWGSFALVDPVALCAADAQGTAVNPRAMVSPRFHTLFDPATYADLKKDKRRMHMQYLMAGQLPGAYDYFSWTAGAQSLRQRGLHKANS